MVKLDSEQMSQDYNKRDECAAAARFFLSGPKKARDALQAYLTALGPVGKKRAEQQKKELETGLKTKPKTEEEEEARFKDARTGMRDGEKKLLEEAYQAAFGSLTDSDWKTLEAGYLKSLH